MIRYGTYSSLKFSTANNELTFQSINVIECLEFRQLLLLLRPGLRDSDIPRRTKMRELILGAWREYFVVLRADLAVRSLWYSSNVTDTEILLECRGSGLVHNRYLV